MNSTIFLTESQLKGNGGDSISLADYSLISTANVGTYESGATPMMELENYNQLSLNLLLNGDFSDGTTTSWVVSGSAVVQTGTFPGLQYQISINNLSTISQSVSGFAGKHPVFIFWHLGNEAICSLELRDGSNNLIATQNRIFPKTDNWLRCSMGYYNDSSLTPISAKISIYSDNDNCYATKCSLLALDSYASLSVGDDYNQNKSVVSISGKKLFVGNNLELISARPELIDFRNDTYIKGNLTITGTITSGPIFGSIGTQSWVTSIVFTSGSQTQINYTSGVIQLISGTSLGVNSGNTGTMTQISYLYLDSDISTSTIQITTDYSLVIGANKIFIGTCYPGTVGNASFVSQSNNLPLINGGDLITPFSITNGNMSINSITASNIVAGTITATQIAVSTITANRMNILTLSALTASMGALSVDNLLTMSGASSAITIGTTPPSSATVGTGIWLDRTGLYSLSANTQNATLTSIGLSAGGGATAIDSTGIYMAVGSAAPNSLSWKSGATYINSIYAQDDGTTSTVTYSTSTVARTTKAINITAVGTSTTNGIITLTVSQSGSVWQGLIVDGSTKTLWLGGGGNGGKSLIDYIVMSEISVPVSPGATGGSLYLDNNGSGKTRLMIKFATGAAQQIAIQP